MQRFGPEGRSYINFHDITVTDDDGTMSAAEREWRTYENAVMFHRQMGNATRNGCLYILDNQFCPWLEFAKRVPTQYLIDTFRRNSEGITEFELHTEFHDGTPYLNVPTTTNERRRFYSTMARCLAQLQHVVAITFHFNDLDGYEALSLFLRRRKTLQQLHVAIKNVLDPPLSENIRRQLKRSTTLREITLKIDCDDITDQQQPALVELIPAKFANLRQLEILSHKATDADTPLRNLADIPPNLQTLRLRAPLPTNTLLRFLYTEKCPVSTLAITCLPSSEPHFLEAVPIALVQLKHLTSLELHLRELLPDMYRWCCTLARCPLLQKVHIFTRPAEIHKHRYLCARAWEKSLAHLQKSPSLHTVHICATFQHCTIGRTLVRCVSCLAQNSRIRRLTLEPRGNFNSLDSPHHCLVSIEEGSALVTALKRNYTIQHVPFHVRDLHDTGRGADIKTEAKTILTLNSAGRVYMLEDPSSKTRGVNVLLAVRDNLNCLYFHLLENPNLCSRQRGPPRRPTSATTRKRKRNSTLYRCPP